MAKSNDKLSLLSSTDSVPCKHVHYINKSLLVLSASTDEGESVWIRFAHSHRVTLVMAFWNGCFTFHTVQTNRCGPRESTSRSPDSRKYSKKVHWKKWNIWENVSNNEFMRLGDVHWCNLPQTHEKWHRCDRRTNENCSWLGQKRRRVFVWLEFK